MSCNEGLCRGDLHQPSFSRVQILFTSITELLFEGPQYKTFTVTLDEALRSIVFILVITSAGTATGRTV